jgi:mannitol/fructose-specific phosphotransferase system IIA component (Ntr-type)
MRISEIITESTIKKGLEARSKIAAIEELVDLLVEAHEVSMAARATIIESIVAREKLVSTGMEHGVAIPHGAVDSVDDVVAALAVSNAGIDFQSIDGKPTYIVVLLVLPANKYSSSVQTMAGISRLLTHKRLRDRVRNAQSADDIMDIIIEEEEHQILS